MKKDHVTAALVSGILAVLAAIVQGEQVYTNDVIVVTATRLKTPMEAVGSSIALITDSHIAVGHKASVSEILRDLPGVHIAQTGGLGTSPSVFIRGAKSEHTLVLIDGVEINDPSDADRGASLTVFDTEDIERIEVLRGPQSCLYGSDAIGGVINIITKAGKGPPQFWLKAEAGSFATFKESAGVRGGTEAVNYSFAVTRIDSEGISAAREEDGNPEKDGYWHSSLFGRIGWTPADNLGIDVFAKYLDSETEYDDGGGVGGDDPGNVATKQNLFLRSQARLDLLDSAWQQELGVSLATHDRTYDASSGRSTFDSRLAKADWQHNLYLGNANILTIAVEQEDEEAETDSLDKVSAGTFGAFIQDQIDITDSFLVGLATRLDDHEEFGSEVTHRAAPVYRFSKTGTRLKATYGTGFKAPSLYQLYSPASELGNIGNENLEPERSEGWDAGIEQRLLEGKVRIGATYFVNEIEDMIAFENGYVNMDQAEIKGVEFLATVNMTDDLSFNASYTYTDAKDKATDDALIRRPRDRATVGVDYKWSEKANLNVNALYVGRRDDKYWDRTMFSSVDAELCAYTLVNLAGSYMLAENMKLFGRIENLFDEDYEEAKGYGTRGIGAYAGARMTF